MNVEEALRAENNDLRNQVVALGLIVEQLQTAVMRGAADISERANDHATDLQARATAMRNVATEAITARMLLDTVPAYQAVAR